MKKKEFEKYAEVFKALANETRLQILTGIIKDECNVSGIVERLGIPQSTISQHLGLLRNKGIVKGRREGAKVCYQVVDEKVRAIIELLELDI